jgi:hypothetical protein
VFACIFVNRDATALTTSVPQISALSLNYAKLLRVYRQLCHQDIANQEIILQSLIAEAGSVIGDLNATVQAITSTPSNSIVLTEVQIKAQNAVTVMANPLL